MLDLEGRLGDPGPRSQDETRRVVEFVLGLPETAAPGVLDVRPHDGVDHEAAAFRPDRPWDLLRHEADDQLRASAVALLEWVTYAEAVERDLRSTEPKAPILANGAPPPTPDIGAVLDALDAARQRFAHSALVRDALTVGVAKGNWIEAEAGARFTEFRVSGKPRPGSVLFERARESRTLLVHLAGLRTRLTSAGPSEDPGSVRSAIAAVVRSAAELGFTFPASREDMTMGGGLTSMVFSDRVHRDSAADYTGQEVIDGEARLMESLRLIDSRLAERAEDFFGSDPGSEADIARYDWVRDPRRQRGTFQRLPLGAAAPLKAQKAQRAPGTASSPGRPWTLFRGSRESHRGRR